MFYFASNFKIKYATVKVSFSNDNNNKESKLKSKLIIDIYST
jgi:hypothetical protein